MVSINTLRIAAISLLAGNILLCNSVSGFTPLQHATNQLFTSSSHSSRTSQLQMTSSNGKVMSRRREMLTRTGPYFDLKGPDIKFGATANLVTQLRGNEQPDRSSIVEWLKDERSMAMSIWDESLTTDLGNSVYKLETMKLQFITLQISPTVDMKMWTGFIRDDPNLPVFALQSVAFDPRVEILPGMSITPESLGIQIEVVGELRASDDGMGVTGNISFESGGKLPGPLRLLPPSALQAATDSINQTVVNFAVKSFQEGATVKYREFLKLQKEKQQASSQ